MEVIRRLLRRLLKGMFEGHWQPRGRNVLNQFSSPAEIICWIQEPFVCRGIFKDRRVGTITFLVMLEESAEGDVGAQLSFHFSEI